MWSWSNIKNHRQLLKSYKCAYKTKLTQTKVPEEIQKQIQVYLAYVDERYYLLNHPLMLIFLNLICIKI